MLAALVLTAACVLKSATGTEEPITATPLGIARGAFTAGGAVERFGAVPYALAPVGARRFARAEVSRELWPQGGLDARQLASPCIQNPLGDPRSAVDDSGPPSEDCLQLNVWRPAAKSETPRPVLVYIHGGGLCAGWSGNSYVNGSNLALHHDVVVVTVNYRLGALGFVVGEDPSRPGSGGLNGVHDAVVALQWLNEYIGHFGGDASKITVFGQSSGSYLLCTLCVAPAAKGLFRRAALMSGPCLSGGPPGRGWGPMAAERGRNVTRQLLAAHGAASLAELRAVPAEQLQWPGEYMTDLDKAPYFSGYFDDPAVVPASTEELWAQGQINPQELIVQTTSKDGTAAFYGLGPKLGLVAPDQDTNTPEGYRAAMEAAWAADAAAVMRRYPLAEYPSAPAAFLQADADAYVICPSRRMARYAVQADRHVWISEFAHFMPSVSQPQGCTGPNCKGMGCDSGVELDVVPGRHAGALTRLWASHGSDVRYVFGTEVGPDDLGPPNNVTDCRFAFGEEAQLSAAMGTHWAAFAHRGAPLAPWPRSAAPGALKRLRWADAETDGVGTEVVEGMRDEHCDFWDELYPQPPPLPREQRRSELLVL